MGGYEGQPIYWIGGPTFKLHMKPYPAILYNQEVVPPN